MTTVGLTPDRESDANRLAGRSLAAGDATGWFERLYADARAGAAIVPWDRDVPQRLLRRWAQTQASDGAGRTALVVGCGHGMDAEFVAGLGFSTTAFDISPSAVRTARERFPDSVVDYRSADLLDAPAAWTAAFDLVVESYTVQSLPRTLRSTATAAVGRFVAPGGELVVVASALAPGDSPDPGPPWPLTEAELAGFAVGVLVAASVEPVPRPEPETGHVWLAGFRRPSTDSPAASSEASAAGRPEEERS